MADIIQLLSDSVANQIAAGEVIQRPASAVKELLENSVDAGATEIKLIVKDAGKTLIQVIDNGSGMSETDARMCFERHATSKIRKAEDLFGIRSMGFRGEAMASIAAIAQCEMRTKKESKELGTKIVIEGSQLKLQEADYPPKGTSISIKNLFFNVPARRKFLKSNPVEIRHIIEEFERVAISNSGISFSMYHNDNEVFNLHEGSFRQRIVGVFGKNFNEKLVPVEEETNIVNITGFVGKPDAAKKTRGEQFLFVNNRFIKSHYLHNAIQNAFSEMIPQGYHPSYFLNLGINPESIDINIHPTKTEIKFEDEKSIYAILRSAVKQSLGKYNISPSLDFDQEQSFQIGRDNSRPIESPKIKINPDYNPFEKEKSDYNQSFTPIPSPLQTSNKQNWDELYEGLDTERIENQKEQFATQQVISSDWKEDDKEDKIAYQLHNKYIITQIKSGVMLIHQQRAHERILFEKYLKSIEENQGSSQQQLFPETITLSPADFQLVKEIENEIKAVGFDFNEFGKNCIIIHGIPSESANENAKDLIDGVLHYYHKHDAEIKIDKRTNLARALAKKSAIKVGKKLNKEEIYILIDRLFACEMPYAALDGEPTIITLTVDELDKKFEKQR